VSKIGKILGKMGQKKRIAGKKNRWKKSKIGASLTKNCHAL